MDIGGKGQIARKRKTIKNCLIRSWQAIILLEDCMEAMLRSSPSKVPATPRAQGGHRSDTQDLCHAWSKDPSRLSIGHATLGVENASYP
jgi:hypothetical protein